MTIRTLMSATTWSWKDNWVFAVNHWNSLLVALLRHDAIAPVIWVFSWFLPVWARSHSAAPLHSQAHRDDMGCVVVESHRSAERRRSSLVVSLPGLEVFPGDLLVSDSAMDYLPYSSFLLTAGQIQDGLCSSEPSKSWDWNVCACGMGGREDVHDKNMRCCSLCGDPVIPHQSDCTANFKIPIFSPVFFPLHFTVEYKMQVDEGRAQITLLLHMLEETRVQVRMFIWKQLRCNSLPPQVQADRKAAHAVVV